MKFIFYTILTALTVLVAFQVYALVCPDPVVRQHLTAPPPPHAAPQTPAPRKKQIVKSNEMLGAITRRNLFDVDVERHPEPKPEKISRLEKTSLKLKLWGTVTTPGKKNKGWAVIEDLNERKQDLYQVNDTIQKGTVKSILRNKIILSVNGKNQVLEVSPALGPGRTKRAFPAHPSPKHPHRTAGSKRKEIDLDAMEELTGDIEPAPKQPLFKTRAYYRGGRESGVMIYGIRRGSGAQALGLRNGDVVRAVDDTGIKSPQDLERIMESMDGDSDITVSVIRRGKTKEIVYSEQEKSYAVNEIDHSSTESN